jgi:Family of unknown function (DUF5367)
LKQDNDSDKPQQFLNSTHRSNHMTSFEVKKVTTNTKIIHPGLFIITGIALWLEALLFIRWEGATLFITGNPWLSLLLVACIPIAWMIVQITAVVAKVDGEDLFRAISLMALTALLLDGVGLIWFQDWYGLKPAGLVLAAASLLWGVGVSLSVGYWVAHRPVR